MHPLTATHRTRQLALRAATVSAVIRAWPMLDLRRLEQTFPGWLLAMGAVVNGNRAISAGLAARYLREFQSAQGVAEGQVALTGPTDPAQLLASLRVTSLVSVKAAMIRGLTVDEASRNALVATSGSATRLVLEGGRRTLMESLRQDPRRPRYQRVTSGRACSFCAMLAGRGAVYAQETGGFDSHDHCGCTAEPVYRQ